MTDNFVPAGIYKGRAINGNWKVSGKKESEFVELTCVITQEGPFHGRQLTAELWLSEKTLDRSLDSLEAVGVNFKDHAVIELVGLGSVEADFTIEIEPPRPREDDPSKMYPERNRIAWINKLGSSPRGQLMTAEQKAAVAGKLEGYKMRYFMKQNGSGPTDAAGTPPPPNGTAAYAPPPVPQTSPAGAGGQIKAPF